MSQACLQNLERVVLKLAGRCQKCKIQNEKVQSATLMVFIIGIIIFMTVGKVEGDLATLTCACSLKCGLHH